MNLIEGLSHLARFSSGTSILIFMIIYIFKPIVMFIPLPVLYISAAIIFPTWLAFIITFGGVGLALTSGYYSGKFLGKENINKYLSKNKRVTRFLEDQNEALSDLCFPYRILPLPFDLFNMLCGAIGVSFWKYLLVSLLGLSTFIIPNILAGVYITTPLSPRFLVPFGISLVITSSVFILYKRGI